MSCIAVVVAEPSGDLLGAGLIRSLLALRSDLRIIGVAGPHMREAGCQSFQDMEPLAVMGLLEILTSLPRLYRLRRRILRQLLQDRPCVVVCIDAPDFMLGLEKRLKYEGITTVHYVSPSIWAWREKRLETIKQAVCHMLTLFPFERAIYQQAGIPVTCVGHPFAEEILSTPAAPSKQLLIPKRVALLPGSRQTELKAMTKVLLETASLLQEDCQFYVALPNAARAKQFEEILKGYPSLRVSIHVGQARDVIASSAAVVCASGTVTLEAMLLMKPMVVIYRTSKITHWLVSKLIRVPHIALPNLLAGQRLVPELIQQEAHPQAIAAEVRTLLTQDQTALKQAFHQLGESLCLGGSCKAAKQVLALGGELA